MKWLCTPNCLCSVSGIGGKVVDCPSLDRLVAILDAKGLAGKYDSSVYLKAQVDNLQGRNDELRAELREARHEANKSNLQLDKAQTKVSLLLIPSHVIVCYMLKRYIFHASSSSSKSNKIIGIERNNVNNQIKRVCQQ